MAVGTNYPSWMKNMTGNEINNLGYQADGSLIPQNSQQVAAGLGFGIDSSTASQLYSSPSSPVGMSNFTASSGLDKYSGINGINVKPTDYFSAGPTNANAINNHTGGLDMEQFGHLYNDGSNAGAALALLDYQQANPSITDAADMRNLLENGNGTGSTSGMLGGMSGKDIAGIGLGVFNGINTMVGNDRNYRLQKKALNDQLKTSEMQRGLAADNYINQQGVRNSLAGAFGVKSTAYADAKKKYGGFSSGLGS